MSHGPALLWFRQDLRLTDNPALAAAARDGRPVIPVYLLDDATLGVWAMGGASRWWLHHSLEALDGALRTHGSRLILRRGKARDVIPALVAETGAGAVYWNRCYEPFAIARDSALKAALQADGVTAQSCNAGLLFEPWEIASQSGAPYRVYTPFWKACLAKGPAAPAEAPDAIARPDIWPQSDGLEDLAPLPRTPDWAGGLRAEWTPGSAGARARLGDFLDTAIAGYKEGRNRPDFTSTSRLSPHLHFGEIGPREVFAATRAREPSDDHWKFLAELGWREFSHHLLYHLPDLPDTPLRPEFAEFPWNEDPAGLRAWQQGRTGYPIVDAGMRELWETGWMHNRVRMVAASFLIKDLLVPWQDGAAWFWDTLVDADLANNAASWQWVAGCGADAAPYFRVFNPVTQGEKFDPEGAYVRRFVPELADMPNRFIHKPWEAPADVLCAASVALGETYPAPIVDHGKARKRALAAFNRIKKGKDAA